MLPFDFEVSFEAHITGVVSGVILALMYRDQGPEPERSWLDDEEEELEDVELGKLEDVELGDLDRGKPEGKEDSTDE